MSLEWSAFARADRAAIFDYIETDNPSAATAVDERIGSQLDVLIRFPETGRPGPSQGAPASSL